MRYILNNHGSALLVVLLTISIIFLSSSVLISNSITTSSQIGNSEGSSRAFDQATMGLEFAKAHIENQVTTNGCAGVTFPANYPSEYFTLTNDLDNYTDRTLIYRLTVPNCEESAIVEIELLSTATVHSTSRSLGAIFEITYESAETPPDDGGGYVPPPEPGVTVQPSLVTFTKDASNNYFITVRNEDPIEAIIRVKNTDKNILQTSPTIGSKSTHTFNVGQLAQGQRIIFTAVATGKTESSETTFTAPPSTNESFNGFVLIINSDTGEIQYQNFDDTIRSDEPQDFIVVTSSVGTYTTNGDINLISQNGIIIEEDVSLTMTQSGQGELNLYAANGDIILNNVDLTNNANSIQSNIHIIADKGNVDIRDSILFAERDVYIRAGKNIFAQRAWLRSNKNNGSIQFELRPNVDYIYVAGLTVNKNATTIPATNIKICGRLASGTVNNVQNHNNPAYCN